MLCVKCDAGDAGDHHLQLATPATGAGTVRSTTTYGCGAVCSGPSAAAVCGGAGLFAWEGMQEGCLLLSALNQGPLMVPAHEKGLALYEAAPGLMPNTPVMRRQLGARAAAAPGSVQPQRWVTLHWLLFSDAMLTACPVSVEQAGCCTGRRGPCRQCSGCHARCCGRCPTLWTAAAEAGCAQGTLQL